MVDSVVAMAPAQFGRPLQTGRAELLESLDPVNFVNVRGIPADPHRRLS